MEKLRIGLVVCMILMFIAIGIIDIRNKNITTGMIAFLLSIVHGLIFFTGAK